MTTATNEVLIAWLHENYYLMGKELHFWWRKMSIKGVKGYFSGQKNE